MQTWLNKLDYKYKYIYKNIFIDRYKQADMIKDYINFLKVLKDLKPYIIQFEKNEIMIPKIYLDNYIVEDLHQ